MPPVERFINFSIVKLLIEKRKVKEGEIPNES